MPSDLKEPLFAAEMERRSRKSRKGLDESGLTQYNMESFEVGY